MGGYELYALAASLGLNLVATFGLAVAVIGMDLARADLSRVRELYDDEQRVSSRLRRRLLDKEAGRDVKEGEAASV